MPAEFRWELLAQHWHCTPAEARQQGEDDVQLALLWQAGMAEYQREEAYFGHA
jgi:hypothetical protein